MLFEEKYTLYSKLDTKRRLLLTMYVLLLIQPFSIVETISSGAQGVLFSWSSLTFFLITDSVYQRYLLSYHSRCRFSFPLLTKGVQNNDDIIQRLGLGTMKGWGWRGPVTKFSLPRAFQTTITNFPFNNNQEVVVYSCGSMILCERL